VAKSNLTLKSSIAILTATTRSDMHYQVLSQFIVGVTLFNSWKVTKFLHTAWRQRSYHRKRLRMNPGQDRLADLKLSLRWAAKNAISFFSHWYPRYPTNLSESYSRRRRESDLLTFFKRNKVRTFETLISCLSKLGCDTLNIGALLRQNLKQL
jgi:hypothetical protein